MVFVRKPTFPGGKMAAVKELMTNKWLWIALTLLIAFLVYHAPRIADSLPLI
jgi:hypothetical protein